MEERLLENLLLEKIEMISNAFGYDFLYENEDDQGRHIPCTIQIIKRDFDGIILATVLTMQMMIDEQEDKGEVVFYHSKGEFARKKVSLYDTDSILEVLEFIQKRFTF